MTEPPEDLLYRAAVLLRSRSERARTGERWEFTPQDDGGCLVGLQPSSGTADATLPARYEHADYIALMDPEVGEAIARLLFAAAGRALSANPYREETVLRVARAMLRKET